MVDRSEFGVPHVSGVRVDAAGRVVIPADLRQKYGIKPGCNLTLTADDAGMRLMTRFQAIKAAQQCFAPYRRPGVSIVDELITEREEEARRDHDR